MWENGFKNLNKKFKSSQGSKIRSIDYVKLKMPNLLFTDWKSLHLNLGSNFGGSSKNTHKNQRSSLNRFSRTFLKLVFIILLIMLVVMYGIRVGALNRLKEKLKQ